MLFSCASRAQAHPEVDRGVASAMDADFEAALKAFAFALESKTLTRQDLVQLLAERALVWHALGQDAEARNDLRYLGALEPTHDFRGRAPPPLMELWSWIATRAQPVALRTRAESRHGGVRIVASLEHEPGIEKPSVRIATRTAGEDWRVVMKDRLDVPTPAGESVEYYAEALGLGGAMIASDGSAQKPKRVASFVAEPTPSPLLEEHAEPSWASRNSGWLIGTGAVATVAVIVAVVVVSSSGGDSGGGTRVTPMVEF